MASIILSAAGTAIDAARSGGERALGLIAMASGMRIVDRPADGLELLQEAQPLAEQAALVLDLSHLHELRGNLLFSLGRADECRQAHEQALALAREAGSAEAECAALGGIGDASYSRGRVVSGARLVQQCVDMAREQGFLKVEMAYLPMVSWSSYYMLQLPQALAVSARAIALASRVRNPRAEMMARAQVVMIDGCIRGNHVPAMAHVDRALELTQMMGSRRFEAITWFFRALLVMRGGDLAAARAHLETAFRMVEDGARTLAFMGAQLYGLKAMLADDASTLHEALAAGAGADEATAAVADTMLYAELDELYLVSSVYRGGAPALVGQRCTLARPSCTAVVEIGHPEGGLEAAARTLVEQLRAARARYGVLLPSDPRVASGERGGRRDDRCRWCRNPWVLGGGGVVAAAIITGTALLLTRDAPSPIVTIDPGDFTD